MIFTILLGCWHDKPDDRLHIKQIVTRLKAIIQEDLQNDDSEINNQSSIEIGNNFNSILNMIGTDIINPLQGEFSQMIENFDNLDLTGYTYNTTSTIIANNNNDCSLQELNLPTFQKDDENES